ncbi:MAG: hypothetical protein AB4372_10785 [Xenococcus sp. (in: cyanobacteria)]
MKYGVLINNGFPSLVKIQDKQNWKGKIFNKNAALFLIQELYFDGFYEGVLLEDISCKII